MRSLRDALELAVVENPDDRAAHHAYADFLQEQGDPRGEFIQLQLALEDEPERRDWQERARQLQAEHQREWLGVLADELLDCYADPAWEGRWTSQPPCEHSFARGWLDRVSLRDIEDAPFEIDLAHPLCRAPEARLLRELILEYDRGQVDRLCGSPYLRNLRFVQLGRILHGFRQIDEVDISPNAVDLITGLPRIEEVRLLTYGYDAARLFTLPNLSSLHTLQVYYLSERYPLEALAANAALRNLRRLSLFPAPSMEPLLDLACLRSVLRLPHLTHLLFQRSDVGDVGCTEIATCGILKRLRVLDLRHGTITDEGARVLADCPDLPRLELLDIERNALTRTGIDALRRVLGPALRGDNQQTAEELAQRRCLYEDDFS